MISLWRIGLTDWHYDHSWPFLTLRYDGLCMMTIYSG